MTGGDVSAESKVLNRVLNSALVPDRVLNSADDELAARQAVEFGEFGGPPPPSPLPLVRPGRNLNTERQVVHLLNPNAEEFVRRVEREPAFPNPDAEEFVRRVEREPSFLNPNARAHGRSGEPAHFFLEPRAFTFRQRPPGSIPSPPFNFDGYSFRPPGDGARHQLHAAPSLHHLGFDPRPPTYIGPQFQPWGGVRHQLHAAPSLHHLGFDPRPPTYIGPQFQPWGGVRHQLHAAPSLHHLGFDPRPPSYIGPQFQPGGGVRHQLYAAPSIHHLGFDPRPPCYIGPQFQPGGGARNLLDSGPSLHHAPVFPNDHQFQLGGGACSLLDAGPSLHHVSVFPSYVNQQFQPEDGARHLLDAAPQLQVRTVWRDNFSLEFTYLSAHLNQGRCSLLGFDCEYVAPVPPATDEMGPPQSADQWYSRLRWLVNNGDVLQISFVLHSEDSPAHPIAFEVNLFFDPDQQSYNPATLEFLEESGHIFEHHTKQGVMPAAVAEWVRSNLEKLTSPSLVLFQADYDLAFFLRSFALENYLLPPRRLDFLQTLRRIVPQFYDVRVIGLKLLGREERGFSLNNLGRSLGLHRIGRAHGSASDALLTLNCFTVIRKSLAQKIHPLVGVLCGIYSSEEIVRDAQPIYNENLNAVEVWSENFSEFASSVLNSLHCNYSVIGIDTELATAQLDQSEDDEYEAFRNLVHSLETVRCSVAMVSLDGQLAGGQTFNFNVCFGNKPRRLNNGKHFIPGHIFAKILISHLLENEKITWATCHGAETMACIFRCIRELPSGPDEYVSLRSKMFPCLYDIACLTENNNRSLLEICQGHSLTVEKSDGEKETVALLIVRCFLKILESRGSAVLENKEGSLLYKSECQMLAVNMEGV